MTNSMECSCINTLQTDAAPEVTSVIYPRARVWHICCECRERILPGKRYERVWGIWGGDISTFKTCMTCVRIRDEYCCNGYYYSGLREALWEALGVDYVTGEIDEDSRDE